MRSQTLANDEELLREIEKGDALALGELYDRHTSCLFSLAVTILEQGRAAEDTLIALFADVWRRPSSYQPTSGSVRSTLLFNLRELALRQRPRQAEWTPAMSESERGSPDSPLSQLHAIQRLPIELAYFRGLSLTQIAQRLNVTKASVRLAIAEGMRACRAFAERA